jgi:hypothetical protein
MYRMNRCLQLKEDDMKGMDLKTKTVKVNILGSERNLRFDMNTFCELEEIYGDLNAAFDALSKMKLKAVRAFVYAALKSEDESITLTEVGKGLGIEDLEMLANALSDALTSSMPKGDDEPGEVTAT